MVFDDMIDDMIRNKKPNSIVTELFIRGRELNISLVFITQSYFKLPKDVKLNPTHYFIMKILNKIELQRFKNFMRLYIKCKEKPHSFLVNNTTLPSDNCLHFRQNLLEGIYNNHDH